MPDGQSLAGKPVPIASVPSGRVAASNWRESCDASLAISARSAGRLRTQRELAGTTAPVSRQDTNPEQAIGGAVKGTPPGRTDGQSRGSSGRTLVRATHHERVVRTEAQAFEPGAPIEVETRSGSGPSQTQSDNVRGVNEWPIANALGAGLKASIWTRGVDTAVRRLRHGDADGAWINGASDPDAPFGGVKQSGLGPENCPSKWPPKRALGRLRSSPPKEEAGDANTHEKSQEGGYHEVKVNRDRARIGNGGRRRAGSVH